MALVVRSAQSVCAFARRQTRRLALNRHAEAFASWPQFGPGGACSWPAKGKIVRRAGGGSKCGRGMLVANHLARSLETASISFLYPGFYCTSSSSSGAAGAQKGNPPGLSIEHRAGPYRAGSVATCTQSGLVLPPETRDTGALALCPGRLVQNGTHGTLGQGHGQPASFSACSTGPNYSIHHQLDPLPGPRKFLLERGM